MSSRTAFNSSKFRKRRIRSLGLTLPEVTVALFIISFAIMSIAGALHTVSKWTLATAIQNEADRLMQAEAERLMSAPYDVISASGDETILSSVATSFRPGTQEQFSYPADGAGARVTFVRRVVNVATTSMSKQLRVEVEWTWQGSSRLVSAPLLRSRI